MDLLPEDILKLIEEHQIEMSKIKKYRRAINNEYEIMFKEETNGANSRYPVNFAKEIKNNIHGYMFGEPFNVEHKKDELLQAFFSEMFTYNNKHKLLSDLGEEILDVGKTYWLLYIDKNEFLKILRVPVEEVIYIKNEKDEDIVDMAIRYYYREGVDINKEELVVEVYTDEKVYYYAENNDGKLVPDYNVEDFEQYHVFGHVPIIEFRNNDGNSEYKDVLPLINLYIKLLNLGIDETVEIRNSYLTILNAFLDDETIEKALKSRVLMIESGDLDNNPVEAKFLNKNINTQSFESFLDRVRRLIFEISGIPDTQSLEQKTQELSAKAMKQLLRVLENKCIVKENNIRQSITRFLRVVRRYVRIKTGKNYNLSDFEIIFKRNVTEDITKVGSIESFVKLKDSDMLDTETLLSLLNFVNDPQNIISKKREEDNKKYGVDYDYEGHNDE